MAAELCVLGIDPGVRGGLALYYPSAPSRVRVLDMPLAGGEVDPHAIARELKIHVPDFAVIERVASRPTDSRPSAFTFGGAYFTARTVLALAGIPFHLVRPQDWKRHHKLSGADDPKEAGRALALRLFPASAEAFARKMDHNRAEAALIARFGAETINT